MRGDWEEGPKLAMAIIRRHPKVFKQVPNLQDVLFVMDDEARPTSGGSPILARVSKIPRRYEPHIKQGDKIFMLEWFAKNQAGMTVNQRYLLMAHQLLHFEFLAGEGDDSTFTLRPHDIQDFKLILDRFGHQWMDPTRGDVADILADGFEWGKLGQGRLDLLAASGETGNPGGEVDGAADGEVDGEIDGEVDQAATLAAASEGEGVIVRAGTPAPDNVVDMFARRPAAADPSEGTNGIAPPDGQAASSGAAEEPWEPEHRYGPKPEADGEDQSDGTLPAPSVS